MWQVLSDELPSNLHGLCAGCLSDARASSSCEGTPSPAWTHFAGFADSGADSGPLGASGAASPALPCSPRRAASFELFGARASSPLGIPRAASASVSRFSLPAGLHPAPPPGAPLAPLGGGPASGPFAPFATSADASGFGLVGAAVLQGAGCGPGYAGLGPAPLASPFGSPPGAHFDVDAFAAAVLAVPGDDEEGGDECSTGWLPADPPHACLPGGASSSIDTPTALAGCGPLTPAPASCARALPSPPAGAAAAAAAALNPAGNPSPMVDARPNVLRCQSLEAALARSSLVAGEAAGLKASGFAPGFAGSLGPALQAGDVLARAASSSTPLAGGGEAAGGSAAGRGGLRTRAVAELLRPEPAGVAKPAHSPRCGRGGVRVRCHARLHCPPASASATQCGTRSWLLALYRALLSC